MTHIALSADDLDDLTSYADGEFKVRTRLAISPEELKEAALNANVEKCPDCMWWVSSEELLGAQGEVDGHCDNCRIVVDDEE